MDRISRQNSFFNQEARHLISRSNRGGGIYFEDIERLVGHLLSLRDAINDGLLIKMENEVTASDFSDFLDHARSYYDDQQKIQGAIIASAVFEDAVRRMGEKNGITNRDKLEGIINALKSSGAITKTEAKKLKYYAGIRNSALHASWDEFDLSAVGDLITGTQHLIDNYLAAL